MLYALYNLLTDDRRGWRDRTFLQDWLQTWQTPFVEFASAKKHIKAENLLLLSDCEKSKNLYQEVLRVRASEGSGKQQDLIRREINNLTWYGIWYYGIQLTVLELSTLGAVYMLKLIIDYLQATVHVQN